MISGLHPTQPKAELEIVDLPYLSQENHTYGPNQILIDWCDYRFGAANIVLYEHDDDTNYKDLATALAGAVAGITAVLKPEAAIVATIAEPSCGQCRVHGSRTTMTTSTAFMRCKKIIGMSTMQARPTMRSLR